MLKVSTTPADKRHRPALHVTAAPTEPASGGLSHLLTLLNKIAAASPAAVGRVCARTCSALWREHRSFTGRMAARARRRDGTPQGRLAGTSVEVRITVDVDALAWDLATMLMPYVRLSVGGKC